MDLPQVAIASILDNLAYEDLKSMSLINHMYHREVQHKLRRDTHIARNILERSYPGSTQIYNDQQLMERVYYLNDYKNGNATGITIINNGTTWAKNKNRVINTVHGAYYEEEWKRDKKYHRMDGPAVTAWHSNGTVMVKKWYINGQIRDGLCIYYNDNGHIYLETLYVAGNPVHEVLRNIEGNKIREKWMHNGQTHRVDGPAIITWDNDGNKDSEEWLQYDQHHRHAGPAVIFWGEKAQDMCGKDIYEQWYNRGNYIPPKLLVRGKKNKQ
jgi:antitoxin component YwqK of YwqJK toxin-antitoxin module